MIGHLKRGAKTAFSTVATAIAGNEDRITLTTRRGPAKGLRFELDLKHRLEYAYWFGSYDREILQRIASVCEPGWTVWDCGTYLGYYTSFFARLVGPAGCVVALEADPRNLERTRHNVTLNGFDNVLFEHIAVGERCGEIDLLISDNTNSHLSGVYIGATRQEYAANERVDSILSVRCTTLDAYYESTRLKPNLIKIDIEGAEGAALEHTSRLCTELRPVVLLELHNPDCDRSAWDWAARHNYRLISATTGQPATSRESVHGTLLCFPRGASSATGLQQSV